MGLKYKDKYVLVKEIYKSIKDSFYKKISYSLFYNIASIRRLLHMKSNLEMFLLPHEMFNKAGSTITIMFGAPISFATFDRSQTHREWAQQVRELVYLMGEYDKKDSWPLPKLENVI